MLRIYDETLQYDQKAMKKTSFIESRAGY